jgi:hypothetical protein
MDGDPENWKKVKMIETILNEATKWKNGIYDVDTNKGLKLPNRNIKMLL